MKLSIITPYYDCLEYIEILRKTLEQQLRNGVEWIIIDDGCYESKLDDFNAKVIHLKENSGCAGAPRNVGLDMASGEYITFIDADDLISADFVDRILENIETKHSYYMMSWWSDNFYIDIRYGRPEWNCSVWGIVYDRNLIGDTRFNHSRIAEDYTFNANVLNGDFGLIPEFLYYYRSNEKGIMSSNGKGE